MHTMVLHSQSGHNRLYLQDGVGWQCGTVGQAVFETGDDTFASFVLSADNPVIIEDFRKESRFLVPTLLSDHGLLSGLCVRITYDDDTVGILAIFSTESRTFDQGKITCLNAVAAMLAVSIGCRRTEETRLKDQERIEQAKQEWEATVDTLPHFICLLDEQGNIVRANRSLGLWVPGQIRDIRNLKVHEVLHPNCTDDACDLHCLFEEAWDDVMKGRHIVTEVDDKVLQRKLEIQLRPTTRRMTTNTPPASLAVLVVQDITRVKRAEELLKNSNNHLEILVQERTNELMKANEQLWCEILERRRVEDDLRQSEYDMRLLSEQLLTAQEMERKRIADELHDGISQSLAAIKFSIENAVGRGAIRSGGKRDDLIETILIRIQTAIEEVHRISTNLRPSMLDDLGIIPTIAWFCREFHSIYSDIRLNTYIDIPESDIPVRLKTVIYRILQEALNNIANHSRANYASIHLRQSASMLEFLIQDDGIGFDMTRPVQRDKTSFKGAGIASMRERAEFSGGAFSITSGRDAGTTIRVTWPLHHSGDQYDDA